MSEEAMGEMNDSQDTEFEGTDQGFEGDSEGSEQDTPEVEDSAPKTYKVKVDGEEVEVTEDELLRGYQMRKASDKRFAEANQARKQAEEFVRLLKTDPTKVLSHPSIGHDVKKLAEDYLLQEMEKEMMTPEQKQLQEYQQKLAAYEAQEKKAREQYENQQKEAIRQRYQEDYNKQIVDALESSGLPKTEHTVKRMIHYMANALEKGYELTANDVVGLVRNDYIEDTKSLYSGLDGDALIKILGDGVAKKLRKHELNQFKKQGKQPPVQNQSSSPRSTGKEPQKLSKDDWRKEIERKAGF